MAHIDPWGDQFGTSAGALGGLGQITTTGGTANYPGSIQPITTHTWPSPPPAVKPGTVEYLKYLLDSHLQHVNPELFEQELDQFICAREGHRIEGKKCGRCKVKVAKLVRDEIRQTDD